MLELLLRPLGYILHTFRALCSIATFYLDVRIPTASSFAGANYYKPLSVSETPRRKSQRSSPPTMTSLKQTSLYALGFAGSIEALGVISDTDFITAMVLLLLALFFVQLGDHAAEREAQRRRYIDRRHARPEEPEYRQNRRDASRHWILRFPFLLSGRPPPARRPASPSRRPRSSSRRSRLVCWMQGSPYRS